LPRGRPCQAETDWVRPSVGRAAAAGGLDVGVVDAVVVGRAAAGAGFAQAQVDDAGDGVGAVLGRGAVTQHLHAFDRDCRNRVEVEGGRAAADRAVDVDQGADVTAHAVDQHQGLVRSQAPQRGRTHVVGAVGDGRARKVDGRGQVRERLGQFGAAALASQGLAADHVDRRDGVQACPARRAGASDDQLLDLGPPGGVWGLGGREGRQLQERAGRDGGQQKMTTAHVV
jgi:hypothetical protein